ncbi:hypothetical protein BT96DRAFT_885861 [Gymnopus androsaceus JB14]|uniref:ABC1 atypical kinase-like domain-containing protein n=1 Tax=Gymnopus androsaceus JB14 TaxID=1447944 RepID=A0A6A4HA39_9AGAR|nr:hypothetical protein BT96DRAFT_885861 [Gymnopus androsaceus JB14]
MSVDLCAFYDNEDYREFEFRKLIGEFLGLVIPKAKIGDYTTDGAVMYEIVGEDGMARLIIEVKLEQCGHCDPTFQVALHYLENVRLVRKYAVDGNAKAAAWTKSRLPSILISHAGPNIQVFGGVMADRPQTEVLSAPIPMYFQASNEDMMLDLARTLTALGILFTDVGELYRDPPPAYPVQYSFPYPRSFDYTKQTTSFTYAKRVDPARLVFEVKTEHNDVLYVKFTRQYGEAAHRKAHELGFAPKLLACDNLEGGWKMVVMERIPGGFVAVDDLFRELRADDITGREEVKAMIRHALEPFFAAGYVHGDLRPANIFVDAQGKKVLIVDYDWAGPIGEVTYPPNVWVTKTIWRPEADLSFRLIELQHDRKMVEHLYPSPMYT